jgi:hypothetical protein
LDTAVPQGGAVRRAAAGYREAVAHITGHVRIAAPTEQVFDTVADTRHEPSFNTAMTGVELLRA